jgi:hypothetical protein
MPNKTQLIVTHPGSAHFDDVTAVSLVLASYPGAELRVERRTPTPEELDDPGVWVIDVGDRHEPEKRNFDHHHSLDCPASFVLVARYLGIEETMSVMPWWLFKDDVDRMGPVKASAKHQAGDHLVNKSPVESWLADSFAARPDSSLPMLRDFGKHLIQEARLLKEQVDFWKACRKLDIAGVPAIIGETRESAGLEEFRRLAEDPPDIVISMDRRDNGWRLFRYEGTPVDFNRLAGRPEISFAHKSGFIAKTRERLSVDELVGLISHAVIAPRKR